MPQINTLFFDLGFTLMNFHADWSQVMPLAIQELQRALITLGYEVQGEEFRLTFWKRLNEYYVERDMEFIEYTTTYLLNNLLEESGIVDVPGDHLQAAVDAMYGVTEQFWLPEEDAAPTLQVLAEQGYRMAIISNAGDDRDVQALVEKTGLRHYFELVLSSAAAGYRKPNPRIFTQVLEQMQVLPAEAAMIGDTLGADILGAQNSGILDIWISRRADTPANRAHAGTIHPTLQINTLGELPLILIPYSAVDQG
jgi:HAD superfamily hydrolase (TIGR01662 family)